MRIVKLDFILVVVLCALSFVVFGVMTVDHAQTKTGIYEATPGSSRATNRHLPRSTDHHGEPLRESVHKPLRRPPPGGSSEGLFVVLERSLTTSLRFDERVRFCARSFAFERESNVVGSLS
jgi:hypothetical protein